MVYSKIGLPAVLEMECGGLAMSHWLGSCKQTPLIGQKETRCFWNLPLWPYADLTDFGPVNSPTDWLILENKLFHWPFFTFILAATGLSKRKEARA